MILRSLYLLVMAVCIVPLLPGLAGVLMASTGFIPPLGMNQLTADAFAAVAGWPGIGRSVGLTVFSALVSTWLACAACFFILQTCWQKSWWRRVELSLSPLLAMPHVAFAVGFGFLFAPTGMIARFWQLWGESGATGSQSPWLVQDPYALGLTLMLALKEIPFLLLMSIPVLRQLNPNQILKVSASLGYSPAQAWWKCILPLWLEKIRFPLLAVLAYGASVVDVSLILGPGNPPTLAVLVWQWFNDPDLSLLPRAAAGAVLLFALTCALIATVRLTEWLVNRGFNHWQYSGRSGRAMPGKSLLTLLFAISAAVLPLTLVWSFAQRWRFPDLMPARFSARFWEYEWDGLLPAISESLHIALISATLALLLAVIAHEYRQRSARAVPGIVIALPMLLPQLSLLFGLQVTSLWLSADSYFGWVCWAHLFFAFPYIYLALDGPWRSYDEGLSRVALSLGKSPLQVWFKVKLPLLVPALLFGWAVGISVSLTQYLPTLMLGAGRITTITTEAVALTSGHDRRVSAIYALCQALLPLLFFGFALLASRLKRRHRKPVTQQASHHDTACPQLHHS